MEKNFFENDTTVQFDHRLLGITTLTSVIGYWGMTRIVKNSLPPSIKLASNTFLIMSGVQVGLGLATLLMFVPTHVAATHQAGSLTLLTISLWTMFELARYKVKKVKKIPKV